MIAKELGEEFGDSLAIDDDVYLTQGANKALGTFADYRVELALASNRIFRDSEGSTLYTHSLIDNLAYASYALLRYELSPGISDESANRLIVLLSIIGVMLKDSFKYDHVFFLTGDFDPNDKWDEYNLQAILQMIMDDYQINYSIIDSDDTEAVEKITQTLRSYV